MVAIVLAIVEKKSQKKKESGGVLVRRSKGTILVYDISIRAFFQCDQPYFYGEPWWPTKTHRSNGSDFFPVPGIVHAIFRKNNQNPVPKSCTFTRLFFSFDQPSYAPTARQVEELIVHAPSPFRLFAFPNRSISQLKLLDRTL